MSIRNALFVAVCALFIGACGRGPNPATDLECFITGEETFTFAAANDTDITSYSLFVTYADDEGNDLPYSSYEFTVISTIDEFLPCLGGNCAPGVATRTLESKASDSGIALFDALITAGNVSTVPIDIYLFGNTKPQGCEISFSVSIAAP